MSFLQLIRSITPRWGFRLYHRTLATVANVLYGFPARQLVVIGVTGTDGKTTTATMIASILQAAGKKVGLSSTVFFQVGDKRWLNETHMTMPGRFALPLMLRQMVRAGCTHAVLEVSSEGLSQFRLQGIDVDVAVLTNITPEHLKTHGSFEAYRAAKGRLFHQLNISRRKVIAGQPIKRISVVNLDDDDAQYFLQFPADEQHGYTLLDHTPFDGKVRLWQAADIRTENGRTYFKAKNESLSIPLPGRYNVQNALAAMAVSAGLDIDWIGITQGLASVTLIPGRFEDVPTGKDFRVVVDYALTPAALRKFYEAVRQLGAKRILAVFGAAGGGRDTWKRPELGKIAGELTDHIFLTTDDPYNDDPADICAAIMAGIPDNAKNKAEIVLDRREAIRQALSMAQAGDVVAITGMGAETSMMVKGKKVEWNDVKVVKEELLK